MFLLIDMALLQWHCFSKFAYLLNILHNMFMYQVSGPNPHSKTKNKNKNYMTVLLKMDNMLSQGSMNV